MPIQMPTEAQEQADPSQADDIYQACTKFLIAKTRDTKKFPLLFEENIAYGFRRNLLGLKPVGILLSVVSTIFCGAKIWRIASAGTLEIGEVVLALAVLARLAGTGVGLDLDSVRFLCQAAGGRVLAALVRSSRTLVKT